MKIKVVIYHLDLVDLDLKKKQYFIYCIIGGKNVQKVGCVEVWRVRDLLSILFLESYTFVWSVS